MEDVDKAMKYGPGFRYPVLGPFETADLGLGYLLLYLLLLI